MFASEPSVFKEEERKKIMQGGERKRGRERGEKRDHFCSFKTVLITVSPYGWATLSILSLSLTLIPHPQREAKRSPFFSRLPSLLFSSPSLVPIFSGLYRPISSRLCNSIKCAQFPLLAHSDARCNTWSRWFINTFCKFTQYDARPLLKTTLKNTNRNQDLQLSQVNASVTVHANASKDTWIT